MIHRLLKTKNILTSAKIIKPILFVLFNIFLSAGIFFSLFNSPADYQQGQYVRIMYVHVPSAWLGLLIYSLIDFLSFAHLVFASKIANIIARELAPIGCCFTLITLITGSLWGKPTWGPWWVWDARLTFMLILLFFYIAYIALVKAMYNNLDSKAPSALAILGFINVPIIKFSVDIWNSLHQPASVFKLSGPSIDNSMLIPLFLMFIASLLVSALVLLNRLEQILLEKKLERSPKGSD